MKKRIGLLVLTLTLCLSGIQVQAKGHISTKTLGNYFDLFLQEVKGADNEESLSSLKDSINDLVKNIKPEDAKKILQFVEKKIEEGKWESKKGIEEAIAEGEKEFGVKLTKEQKDMIISVSEKIKKLGIDPTYLVNQAEKIYEKYSKELKEDIIENSKEIVEETQNKIKEDINKSLTNYFTDMVKSVKSFFRGIFKK